LSSWRRPRRRLVMNWRRARSVRGREAARRADEHGGRGSRRAAHLLLALARRLERDRGGLGAAELRERAVGAAPLEVDLRASARGRVRQALEGAGRASRGGSTRARAPRAPAKCACSASAPAAAAARPRPRSEGLGPVPRPSWAAPRLGEPRFREFAYRNRERDRERASARGAPRVLVNFARRDRSGLRETGRARVCTRR
jgi:hypothetical protein